MKDIIRKMGLAVLSGALGFLAFPPYGYSLLIAGALIPLFLAIRTSTPRTSFWLSYISGIVFFSGLLYWLINVSIPGTIILVLFLSLYYGIFGYLASLAFNHSMDLLILPFVWVVIEYLRSHIFTGFPWGLLAYSQYKNISVIQLADITGPYGISFIIVALNVAFYAFLDRIDKRITYMAGAMFLIVLATFYSKQRLENLPAFSSAKIGVVQGNIPQSLKWEPRYAAINLKTYNDLTVEAASSDPDMIIWPETAYPYLVTKDDTASDIGDIAKEVKTPVLAGIVRQEDSKYYNSAVFFDEKGSLEDTYSKMHLVPFGEYIPFKKYLSLLRKYIDKPIGDFEGGTKDTLFKLSSVETSLTGGGGKKRIVNYYKFGTLICFEDIFPYIARNFVKNGASFLVNITNDAWFGNTGAAEQHVQSSVFRAVENRVPVVRSANTGVSCFIDSTGEILSRIEEDGKDIFIKGVLTGEIRISRQKTFYTTYGDIFAYFCGLMVLLLCGTEIFLLSKERKGKKTVQ